VGKVETGILFRTTDGIDRQRTMGSTLKQYGVQNTRQSPYQPGSWTSSTAILVNLLEMSEIIESKQTKQNPISSNKTYEIKLEL